MNPVYPIRPVNDRWMMVYWAVTSIPYTPVNDRLMSFDPSDGNMASPRSALPIAANPADRFTLKWDAVLLKNMTEYMTEYVQNAMCIMCSISKWYNKTYRPWPTRGFTSCASIFWCGKFKGLRNWLFKSVQPVPLELYNARPVLSSAGVHLILERDKSVLFTQQIGFVGSQDKSALAC